MKEDILEQLVEDYFQHQGYFTLHNVKFRPDDARGDYKSRKDSSPSDIDVLGINPNKRGVGRVIVVSCKSWQNGFSAERYLRELEEEERGKKLSGRERWKYFRELAVPKWSRAFRAKIQNLTGHAKFTYYVAVTKLNGDYNSAVKAWREYGRFKKALDNNPMEFLTAKEILNKLWEDKTKTMAASEVGRLLQVVKASRWNPPGKK